MIHEPLYVFWWLLVNKILVKYIGIPQRWIATLRIFWCRLSAYFIWLLSRSNSFFWTSGYILMIFSIHIDRVTMICRIKEKLIFSLFFRYLPCYFIIRPLSSMTPESQNVLLIILARLAILIKMEYLHKRVRISFLIALWIVSL